MKVKLVLSMVLLLGTISIYSCKKDAVKGCMDTASVNYNSQATEDDGNCRYQGSMVFYYDEANANELVANGSTSLTYYVDNVIVGSSAANVFYNSTPECGANGTITVTKDLGANKSASHPYKIIDDKGTTIYQGAIVFIANTCIQLKLK